MVKVLNCNIEVSRLGPQSYDYVYFRFHISRTENRHFCLWIFRQQEALSVKIGLSETRRKSVYDYLQLSSNLVKYNWLLNFLPGRRIFWILTPEKIYRQGLPTLDYLKNRLTQLLKWRQGFWHNPPLSSQLYVKYYHNCSYTWFSLEFNDPRTFKPNQTHIYIYIYISAATLA